MLFLNCSAVLMVESLWLLVWSSVHCYKERYELDSTSSKQALADPDFTSGLSTAGARLKKVMRRCFEMVDGTEYFEVHKGEWVRSDSAPVGGQCPRTRRIVEGGSYRFFVSLVAC